ncbi:hypothetical protein [Paraburkholderia tagetis]|uniref:DUF305 domain-containing protein n=1 Tax=Paraburkholderia tagetis TaxID=2913261 RepID=A0A9X1ZYV1_9BURK|nr:hypothetical protein [Paraburkholderia tagetis]MCG5078528.1 hypothetical protein [Paraburkholderia tagetis]
MNTKFLRAAALSAFLLTASVASLAATGGGTSNYPGASAQSREHGSMMGGMMGMDGMMGSCPMMGASMGMDPKTAMRMHGEMMRAMGDIMLKYSDQAGTAPSK